MSDLMEYGAAQAHADGRHVHPEEFASGCKQCFGLIAHDLAHEQIHALPDPLKVEWATSATLDEAMAYSRWLLAKVVADTRSRYDLKATLGLFSGGNDSTTFMHLLRGQFDAAVHINTSIGIEETRQYVRRTCAGWDLPLIEQTPPPGCTYDELVIKHGFPGPATHGLMYTRLKERGLMAVRRRYVENGRKQRVVFVAGMRHFESSRRMRTVEESHSEGSVVWCSPLAWWTNAHMAEYRERFDVPFNEVSANLHMSGECLCGAFAKPDELEQIRFFYPATAERIEALEAKAAAAGVHCKWGTRPPAVSSEMDGQGSFDVGDLCAKCEAGAA